MVLKAVTASAKSPKAIKLAVVNPRHRVLKSRCQLDQLLRRMILEAAAASRRSPQAIDLAAVNRAKRHLRQLFNREIQPKMSSQERVPAKKRRSLATDQEAEAPRPEIPKESNPKDKRLKHLKLRGSSVMKKCTYTPL